MKDISEKLKKYFSGIGYSQTDIANKLGTTQAYVSLMINGNVAFGKKAAHKWQELFGISAAWLLTGEGEMLVSNKKESALIDNVSSETHINNTLGDNNSNIAISVDGNATVQGQDPTVQSLLKIIEEQQKIINQLARTK